MDDEESFLEVASHFMQKTRGLEVHGATSVSSAMEMMSQTSFDVIVSDYQMPETDGIDFLKMIRARGSDMPFILFTGKGRESVAIEALNQGADSYLQKGGDLRSQFHELTNMITQAVRSRRASTDLLESQERFRGLADSISDSLIGLDDDFRVTFWNKAAEEALEVKSTEAIGITVFDLVPRFRSTPVEEALRTAATSRNMGSAEVDLPSGDGAKTFDVNIYPGVEGMLVFVRDSTATKAAAQLLTESEERYKALVEAAPTAIIVFVADAIIYANRAAVRTYGGDDESDILGKKMFDLMPPEFVAESTARIRKMLESSVPAPPWPLKIYTKTGQTLDMEVTSIPITFSGRKAILTMLRDVTEEDRAEALLRAHQEELRTIIDSVPAMISYQDVEGRFLRVNRPFAEATGIAEELLRDRKAEDVLPGFGELFSPRDKKVIETRRPLMGAITPYQAKHSVRWARTDKIPYVDDAGEVAGILTIAEDITDKLDSERKLTRQRVMIDCMDDAAIFTDPDYVIESWNPAAEKIYGFSAEEVMGRNALEVLETDILQDGPGDVRKRVVEEGQIDMVFRQKRKDGEWIHVECTTVCLKDAEGTVIGFGCINKDISERIRAEKELRKSKEAAEMYLDVAADLILSLDLDGNITLLNRSGYALLGYQDEEIIGRNWFDTCLPRRVRAETREVFNKHVLGGSEDVWSHVNSVITRNGDEKTILWHNSLLRDDGGKVSGTLNTGGDITEFRKLEAALDTNVRELSIRNIIANIFLTVPGEDMYAEVLNAVLEATRGKYGVFGYIDENGSFVVPMKARTVLNEHPAPDKTVMHPRDTWGDGSWPEAIRQKQAVIWNHPSTKTLQGDIETTRHLSLPILHAEDVVGLLQVANKDSDYTDDDVQFLKTVCDAIAPLLAARLDHARQDAALRSAEEAVSRAREQVEHLVSESSAVTYSCNAEDPYDATYVSPNVKKLYGYEPEEFSKNPGFWVSMIHPDDSESVLRELQEIFERGYHVHEYRWKRKDGTYAWVRGEVRLIRNEDGVPIQMVGLWLDITERKKAEDGLRMVNKKLNLLGGITRHDSLNQLTVLKGWLATAIEQEGEDSVRDMLLKVEKAADSLKMHMDFTAHYRSLGMKRPGWVPLAEVVAKVTEGLGRQGISVSVEVEDVEIFADPMLENVFRNLVNNSIAHGGNVDSISVSFEEGKDCLVMIYEDNGVGISAEEKAKIFARGYGKRHGYGLYLSWEILSITGMTLKETGIPTKGARFEISVPAGNYRRQSE